MSNKYSIIFKKSLAFGKTKINMYFLFCFDLLYPSKIPTNQCFSEKYHLACFFTERLPTKDKNRTGLPFVGDTEKKNMNLEK